MTISVRSGSPAVDLNPPEKAVPTNDSPAPDGHPGPDRHDGPDQPAPKGTTEAFALGWTMAQLYGPLRSAAKQRTGVGHLPTVAQLTRQQRIGLACNEIGSLLGKIPGCTPPDGGWCLDKTAACWDDAAPSADTFTDAVDDLHVLILGRLAVAGTSALPAYELGRALSDTCWLPHKAQGAQYFLHQFSRYRLAALFAWLDAVGADLSPGSASVVRRSLQHWQDWAAVNTRLVESSWDTVSGPVIVALRRQSKAWEALLSGQNLLSGSPSVPAWAQAATSMVRTVRQFVRTIFLRFWLSLSILLAITGALVYLIVDKTSGATTVWSTLVTVAGSVGVTGAGVRGAGRKAAAHLEPRFTTAAEVDAWAWDITLLPDIALSRKARRELEQAGTAPPQRSPRAADEATLSGMGGPQDPTGSPR